MPRRRLAALVLVLVVGFAASIAKTAFDAIVQDRDPPSRRATFFARLEALFQLAGCSAPSSSTLAAIPLLPGFIVVATVVLITGAARRNRTPRDAPPPGVQLARQRAEQIAPRSLSPTPGQLT